MKYSACVSPFIYLRLLFLVRKCVHTEPLTLYGHHLGYETEGERWRHNFHIMRKISLHTSEKKIQKKKQIFFLADDASFTVSAQLACSICVNTTLSKFAHYTSKYIVNTMYWCTYYQTTVSKTCHQRIQKAAEIDAALQTG